MPASAKAPVSVQWPVQLAPSASVDQPLQDGGPWIIAMDSVPKARVSADVAAVLRWVDGKRDAAQIAQLLGVPWSVADVTGVVSQLAPTGIFDVGAQRSAGTQRSYVGRVQFRAPLTVQFTLFNPAPLLLFLRPAMAALARPAVGAVAVVLLLGAVLSVVASGPSIWKVLATPLPLEAYLYVAAAMFASTLLHELGHGMALTYFGGTPRRIGIMLFYLSPAFFCDVTDGWRLSSRKQRLLVALAGPLVHLGLGSTALALQKFLPESPLKDAALLYGVLCWAVALLNLFPFIKLDGYVALMSAVDIPHLRRKSLSALAVVVRSRLLGTRETTRGSSLLPWFGLASFMAGVGFMVIGFQRIVPIFLQLGFAGHLVTFMVLCLLAAVACGNVVKFFRPAAKNGSPVWRRALLILLGVVAIGTLLAVIPVRPATVAGFTYVNGELCIVTPVGSNEAELEPGDSVTLQSQGVVIHENLGRATIGDRPASNAMAPLNTVVPIALAGNTLPMVCYHSAMEGSFSLPSSGRAEISSHNHTSLGAWLIQAITRSPLWPGHAGLSDSAKGQP
jgi:putative peptide zinc metalloprotease protein